MLKRFSMLALIAGLAGSAGAGTVAENLLAGYAAVQTASCDIRKDNVAEEHSLRTLSKVYYQKPDRLHVENITPIKRRIVCDGTRFYSYISGDPKGFSRPVDRLNEEMLINLRKVPGTAMDHLLRLKGIAETNLDPGAEFAVRKGYPAEKVFVALCLDATGRLARVEFFADASMKEKTAQYDYSAFQEAAPGVWIPCLHQAVMRLKGIESKETVRVDNLAVNGPIAQSLFLPVPFFKDVEFVDSFDKIYP